MIRSYAIIGRVLLLAGVVLAPLAGCAADSYGRLHKLEFAELKQQNWWPWRDKGKTGAKADNRAETASAPDKNQAAATPAPAPIPVIMPVRAAARSTPPFPQSRAIRSRAAPRARPIRATALSKDTVVEKVASAPQGKVEQKQLAVLTDAANAPPKSIASGRYSVEDLMGLNGTAVERLLGRPDLSRQESDAEVWQYTHGECVLFLFLYPAKGGGAEVAHAETGARDGGENPDPRQCISALAARNPAAPG